MNSHVICLFLCHFMCMCLVVLFGRNYPLYVIKMFVNHSATLLALSYSTVDYCRKRPLKMNATLWQKAICISVCCTNLFHSNSLVVPLFRSRTIQTWLRRAWKRKKSWSNDLKRNGKRENRPLPISNRNGRKSGKRTFSRRSSQKLIERSNLQRRKVEWFLDFNARNPALIVNV